MENPKEFTKNENVLINLNKSNVNLLRSIKTSPNHENLFKNGSWDIYYILIHCKIAQPILIEKNIELIPFGEYLCDDYFSVVEKVIDNIIDLPQYIESENWINIQKLINKTFKMDNPLSLLVFKNVKAKNEYDVYEQTKDHLDDIIITISALISSSIELKGWVVEGKKGGYRTVLPDIYFYHYKQVLMHPKRLEEVINDILKEIKENFILKLVLKYENEALSERDQKFRLIKRWSALEFIAEYYSNKNLKNRTLSPDQINQVTEFTMEKIINDRNKEIENHVHNRISQINHRNVKDKIRVFLTKYDYLIRKIDNKDILDIVYQKRNCITHNGGCRRDNNLEGKCGGPAYCRNSKLDLEDLNLELSDILKHFIGKSVNTIFKHQNEIPEEIKKKYGIN